MDFEEFFKNFQFEGNQNQNAEDIPGGFQDLNPEVFALLGELVGNIMAGNMPFNVQNAISNWIMLVGQAIVTYNAQQQYFQSGPGRYYDIKNKNVTNPFIDDEPTNCVTVKEINDLKKEICILLGEVERLKNEIQCLKNEKNL